jgi:hypothetical protein
MIRLHLHKGKITLKCYHEAHVGAFQGVGLVILADSRSDPKPDSFSPLL